MKKKRTVLKKTIGIKYFIVYALFFLSRWYILTNPPFYYKNPHDSTSGVGYSDIKHDSERYANMWHYGLMPYREHLYEYPPAAIPLVYLPLRVDLAGIGTYYPNYRFQIFILETIVFTAILFAVNKLKVSRTQKLFAIGFYITAGTLAKDFWYDGLDFAFIGVFTLALVWRFLKTSQTTRQKVIFWSLFWLSTAIKFMTVPLAVPLFLMNVTRKNWRQEAAVTLTGFLIIWGLPLAIFRSSLSVMFYFHGVRPIKAESFPRFIIESINDFTKTERLAEELPPHFPMVGPISDVVTKIVSVVFPLSILLVIIGAAWYIYFYRKSRIDPQWIFATSIKLSLIYIFAVFLTGKIFSNPFHIWYIPLITLYPFKSIKSQFLFITATFLILTLDTTPYLTFPSYSLIGPVTLGRVRGALRFLPMILLLYQSLKLKVTATDQLK